MPDLTEDELTVLLIAAKGEPMMPIGRWRESAESLVAKGLLQPRPHAGDPTGFFNLCITAAGKAQAEQEESDFDGQLRTMVDVNNQIVHAKKLTRAAAEQIAVQLVDLTELSTKVTGDNKVKALREWSKVILTRALEMMKCQ
jgi:hypothetical protein